MSPIRLIVVTSPATDAGKTFLATGITGALAFNQFRPSFLDYDIAVGDSLRVFGLMEEARRPHPTVTSWFDYTDLNKAALKTKTGVYVFPKPESPYEIILGEDAIRLIQATTEFSDVVVADLGTDHRLPHWEALINASDVAFLVTDCDEKAIVRLSTFIRNSAVIPPGGWVLAVNTREKNSGYSTKEIVRMARELNGVTKVLEIPFIKDIERQIPKTFTPNAPFVRELMAVLEASTRSVQDIPKKQIPPHNETNFLSDNSQVINVMVNGRNGLLTLEELSNCPPSNLDAIFLPTVFEGFGSMVDMFRRNVNYQGVMVVAIGSCGPAIIESGADECFEEISPEVLKIIQAKAQKLKELWNKANIDELTGCYQRNFFKETFNHQINLYYEKGQEFSILTFDLDEFKKINDTMGHSTGDDVLRAFGRHLKNCCRTFDIPIRIGGDEFVLLIPNSNYEEAQEISNRVKDTWPNNFEFQVRFSVGIAQVNKDGLTSKEILSAADRRMYRNKRQTKQSNKDIQISSRNRTNVEVTKPLKKTNTLALVANTNPEGLAAFSVYMANAVSNNGIDVYLIDCYTPKPLIGPMLKTLKTKDWRTRGINATVLINEMRVLPLSPVGQDKNYGVEEKLKNLIQEIRMISKDGLIILHFGNGSPLMDVVKDNAVLVNFKINSNHYQYQLPQMADWDNIPGEPDYERDLAIIELLNKLRR